MQGRLGRVSAGQDEGERAPDEERLVGLPPIAALVVYAANGREVPTKDIASRVAS